MSTFVITGGHHNSALVVAKDLVAAGHQVEWIGHRYAAQGDSHDSAEYIEVKAADIPFHNLVAGKSSLQLNNILNTPLGFVRAAALLTRLKPDAVLSFGGYLGLTVAWPAWLQQIPVYMHEQTSIAGKANKLTARFARRVYVTWESSRMYYPREKVVVTGLPLRQSLINSKRVKNPHNIKTILVLCGKQGSHAINNVIFNRLHDLLASYRVIHQTGMSSVTGDYERAIALKETLPKESASRYEPHGYMGEDELAEYINTAEVVVGRSGAHTTYELAILGKKSVLIPLLTTHGQEQFHNARVLEKMGIGVIIPQSELTFPRLAHEIERMIDRQDPKPLHLPLNASHVLIRDMLANLGTK